MESSGRPWSVSTDTSRTRHRVVRTGTARILAFPRPHLSSIVYRAGKPAGLDAAVHLECPPTPIFGSLCGLISQPLWPSCPSCRDRNPVYRPAWVRPRSVYHTRDPFRRSSSSDCASEPCGFTRAFPPDPCAEQSGILNATPYLLLCRGATQFGERAACGSGRFRIGRPRPSYGRTRRCKF